MSFDTPRTSVQIYLDSKYATTKINSTKNSWVQFQLSDVIHASEDEDIEISILNANIPISFYNINANNNLLRIVIYNKLNDVIISNTLITVPVGNYTIIELLVYLDTQMVGALAGFNWEINTTTNTLYLVIPNTADAAVFFDTFTSTMFDVIGINSTSTLYLSTDNYTLFGGLTLNGVNYTFPDSVNLITVQNLLIRFLGIDSANVDMFSNRRSNILCRIPQIADAGTMLFYEPTFKVSTKISAHTLSSIEIMICDDDGNQLDLNNCRWTMTLVCDFILNKQERDRMRKGLLEIHNIAKLNRMTDSQKDVRGINLFNR